MIWFIYSIEIFNIVLVVPNIFLWKAASVADTAAVNSNGIKTPLPSGLSIFPNKDKPVFSTGCKSLRTYIHNKNIHSIATYR